ncbi:MAG: exopolyphosphatase [Gammaproteobacteria bacterium]
MAASRQRGVIAAVDLGSNSFHMVVARMSDGQLAIVDRIREMVRLGAGVDDRGRIDDEAAARALECLARFSERLGALEADQVRAVGTNTLRRARRATGFLRDAETALGHPIEVISGVEEARLIYLGAAHSLPAQPGRRLVADIGGGSTELIIGEGYDALRLESLYMGCVSASQAFFADGEISEERFREARLFASQELEPVRRAFLREGWEEAVGTSGTIRATARVLRRTEGGGGEITPEGLETLQARLISAGHVEKLDLDGLSSQRAPVFPGGVAILAEIFAALDIRRMQGADGALREGLLYDLVGRLSDEDARDRSVRAFQRRFHVDLAQADRVRATAATLLAQVGNNWNLEDPACFDLLDWAAQLHEVGLDIAHSHHHKHAAYLVRNADLAGFSVDEQRRLAVLVGGHRRKVRRRDLEGFDSPWDRRLPYLLCLLRVAVVLNRSRTDEPLPPMESRGTKHKLKLRFPEGWLEAHPLSLADLETEAGYLSSIGLKLSLR